jgi:hypothetical protein
MVSRNVVAIVTFAVSAAGDLAARPMEVPRVEEAPRVDCRIDEPAWRSATLLDGFRQTYPGDNSAPSHPTEVRLLYTPDALFVAIRAVADARFVRATVAKRDAIGEDDSVALYLDTFRDRRRAYVVMVNPLGVQQDGVFVEGSEPDFSVDLDFQSAGCLTDSGYSVELAIPFSSLRYEAGERGWGLHVIRQLKHAGEENSWMPLRRDRIGVAATTRELRARFLEQAGTLAGIQSIPHAKLLDWIPVAKASRAAGAAALALSGTGRVMLSPASTVDVAVNPDFAELEADQPQSTANQRFPLFFAEKRPFFLEGADLFRTPVRAFHSRSIVDPDAALKLTGTRGRTSGTLLFATDAAPGPEKALTGVVRLRRDVGSQSSLGVLATARSFRGNSNAVAALDGRVAAGARSVWTFQLLGTRGDGDSGFGYYSEWARSDRRTSLQLVGEGYTPGYRADLGYTQRSDMNRWSLVTRYNSPARSSTSPLVSWSAVNTLLAQFDWRGRMQYAYVYPRVLLVFPRQSFLNVYAYKDYLRVFEEEFGPARSATHPGSFAGSAERSTYYHGFTVEGGSAPSQRVSLSATWDRSWNGLDYDLGAGRFPRVSPAALIDASAPLDPGPGDYQLLAGSLAFQPSQALRLAATYQHGRLTRQDTRRDAFDQHLTSFSLHYAFTRATWLRGRVDYDSLYGRLFHQAVLAWTPKPATSFYVGYDETGDWRDGLRSRYDRRDRTFFAKLSWSLRTPLSRAPLSEPRAARAATAFPTGARAAGRAGECTRGRCRD